MKFGQNIGNIDAQAAQNIYKTGKLNGQYDAIRLYAFLWSVKPQ